MGWWESQVANVPDPLSLWKPVNWILMVVAMTAVMFLASWIRRRFGWRWFSVFLIVAGFYQVVRERFWLSSLMPLLKYEPGLGPIVAEAAIFSIGGLLAFLVMQSMERLMVSARRAGANPPGGRAGDAG